MLHHSPDRKFSLGRTVITRNALGELNAEDVRDCLIRRHIKGDWGECCAFDTAQNERALKEGGRLFSVYRDRSGKRFYIITEADRSVTTILLPEDY